MFFGAIINCPSEVDNFASTIPACHQGAHCPASNHLAHPARTMIHVGISLQFCGKSDGITTPTTILQNPPEKR